MLRNHFSCVQIVLGLAVLSSASMVSPLTAGEPEYHPGPKGQLAWYDLTLHNIAGEDGDWELMVQRVGDDLPIVAMASRHWRVWERRQELRFKNGRIRGTVQVWWLHSDQHLTPLSLDLRVADGEVTGTYTWHVSKRVWERTKDQQSPGDDVRGRVQGTIRTEASLKKDNAVSPKVSWPCWMGPTQNFSASTAVEPVLVDDLNKARVVWRSTPIGTAEHAHRTGYPRLYNPPAATGASPLLADGRIYQFHMVPSGEEIYRRPVRQLKDGYQYKKLGLTLEEASDPYRIRADDMVTCIDAATGRTLWRTVFPDEGYNNYCHKASINNHTGVAAEGRVFVFGSLGILSCLDAETGKVQWRQKIPGYHGLTKWWRKESLENPAKPPYRSRTWNHGLNVSGSVVIAPTKPGKNCGIVAFDVKSGKQLWEAQNVLGGKATPIAWRHEGTDTVLCANEDGKINCFNARSGEVLWEITDAGNNTYQPALAEDYLITVGGCYKLSLSGAKKQWDLPGRPNGKATAFVHNGIVWIRAGNRKTAPTRLLGVKLKTGQVLVREFCDDANDEAHAFAISDRLICEPDSQHGSIAWDMYRADPKNWRRFNSGWRPPLFPETSYSVPISHAAGDGRVYVRGSDGIYCLDLRVRPLGSTKWQEITFPELPRVDAGSTTPVELKATASSGLPVRYTVQSGPASIKDARVVPTGETGIVEVLAHQDGDRTWIQANPVLRYLVVGDPSPANPTALSGRPVSNTRIRLSWTDRSDKEEGFRVLRRLGSSKWVQVAELPADANSFTDSNLKPATEYTYRLLAFDRVADSKPIQTKTTTYTDTIQVFYEAEDLDPGKHWSVLRDDTVSGEKFIKASLTFKDPSKNEPPRANRLKWTIHLPVSGDYRVSGRNFGMGGGAGNSYYVRLDDGRWEVLSTLYSWQFGARPQSVVFTDVRVGEHTVHVAIRESDTSIDKFYVRSVSDRLPQPKGLGGKAVDVESQQPPKPCSSVRQVRAKSGQVLLKWKHDGKDSSGFIIECRKGEGEYHAQDFVGPETRGWGWRSAVPLEPDMDWRVRAWNAAGSSKPVEASD
jgi:outer membrane protein assembly factor BamB